MVPSPRFCAVLLSGWHARTACRTLLQRRSSRLGTSIEPGHGHVLGMSEIRLSNKDGVMLTGTSKQADIGAASSAVLPLPDADRSAVSLLNQVPSTLDARLCDAEAGAR